MTVSIKDLAYLRKAVRRLVAAEVADSWKGGQPPEDHPAIEAELKAARRQYAQALARLELLS